VVVELTCLLPVTVIAKVSDTVAMMMKSMIGIRRKDKEITGLQRDEKILKTAIYVTPFNVLV